MLSSRVALIEQYAKFRQLTRLQELKTEVFEWAQDISLKNLPDILDVATDIDLKTTTCKDAYIIASLVQLVGLLNKREKNIRDAHYETSEKTLEDRSLEDST